jgi:hypothetical protein
MCELFTDDLPELKWPTLLNENSRLAWYRSVILAYQDLWSDNAAECFAPVSEEKILALESHLGCALPQALRQYHKEFGVLSLAETLCVVDKDADDYVIQPLLEAFPAIIEITDDEEELALVNQMIVFGDYLGNGNMFCFHRETAEVYYFDHDDGAMLTRFFTSIEYYLDALMILCLAEVHDAHEAAEDLLIDRFGRTLVRKWRY